jgi:CheY-like chemotaxis protein
MSFSSKIDVLDLLIDIIKEHEERMDSLVERLEIVNKTIQSKPELRARYQPGSIAHNHVLSSILIVDDDKNLANSFKIVLQSVGFDVDVARTGTQAIYRAERKNYDLVLLDLNLPDLMGDEVAESLYKLKGDLDIIMITGYRKFKDEMEGQHSVLMKPIPPEELVKITKDTMVKKN